MHRDNSHAAGASGGRRPGRSLLALLGLHKPAPRNPAPQAAPPPDIPPAIVDAAALPADPMQARIDALIASEAGQKQASLTADLLRKVGGTGQHELIAASLLQGYLRLNPDGSVAAPLRAGLMVRLLQTLQAQGRIDEAQILPGLAGAGRLAHFLSMADPDVAAETDAALGAVVREAGLLKNLARKTIDTAQLRRRLEDPGEWESLLSLPHRHGPISAGGFNRLLADGIAMADRMENSGYLSADMAGLLRSRLPDLVQAAALANAAVWPGRAARPAGAEAPHAAALRRSVVSRFGSDPVMRKRLYEDLLQFYRDPDPDLAAEQRAWRSRYGAELVALMDDRPQLEILLGELRQVRVADERAGL